jgi:16S rRNA (cytosine1402-N4)-methyltransferase
MIDHQTHIPVLLTEVLKYLAPEKGDNLLDATAGYGGHSSKILEITNCYEDSVLVDRDENAVKQLKKHFAGKKLNIIHDDFAHATKEQYESGKKYKLILADLGVSSPHLDNASRGFSFQQDGPLDMRMDGSKGLTAADLVNTGSEQVLIDILKEYGDEPRAKRVVVAIIAARPLETTHQLAQVIADVYGGRGRYKTHPATKTFQALRIAVNDELAQLRYALPLWIDMLEPGGRLAVISFHSIEDRIVKDVLQENGGDRYDAVVQILTKKPAVASPDELVFNPRARSAKLRAAVKK